MTTTVVDPKLSHAEYNADPCETPSLRSSAVKTILGGTMKEAWFEHPRLNPEFVEENKTAWDLGTAAHELAVGGADKIVVLKHDAYRSKAAKEERDEAYSKGQTPVLEHQLESLNAMVNALAEQLVDRGLGHVFKGCFPEVSFMWKERGIWNRSRPDWAHRIYSYEFDDEPKPTIVYDYKTTGVDVGANKLSRYGFEMGWDIQAAMITRGIKACLGVEEVEVRFVAQCNKPPYLANVVAMSPYSVKLADEAITVAQNKWANALDSGNWDGHPVEIAQLDTPTWLAEEREELIGEGV